MLMFEGATVPGTKPSSVWFGNAEQSSARAEKAAPSNSMIASNQCTTRRLPLLSLSAMSLEFICALVTTHRAIGSPGVPSQLGYRAGFRRSRCH
jgi:hypothetical protein